MASDNHFLNLIQKAKRGKLKVYLGMSAGVGKTYRMLQEAHSLFVANINVQLGYVETHLRPETHALLAGLPEIPRKKLFYKGKQVEEMDLQAVLIRHPEIVIVDELAHSNIPGSKNEKRWQDVLDILDAGINVITAVNIQHLDSLSDTMLDITGVEITERVPDQVLKMADEVVNIDLSVDDLIQRLKAGKIYTSEKIAQALANFFKRETINQLREQALITVAEFLDKQMTKQQMEPAYNKRFMACISSNYKTAQLVIRKTARLAKHYRSAWVVLYVQTESESGNVISLEKQRHLINNFNLATQLGAKVIKIKDNNVVETITKTVVERKISTLCIGKPHLNLLQIILRTSSFNRLLKNMADNSTDLVILS